MEFSGFPKDALKFLARLSKNNNRDWFNSHRSTYDEELLEPAKAFVVAMAPELYEISPDVVVEPRVNSSIRRISRDTRFHREKKPYKDHLDFFFYFEGAKKEGPGYFVRLQARGIAVGAGTHAFDKKQLARYREAVAADTTGKELERRISKLKRSGYKLGGEHYKRVPTGYDAEHPRAALLKHAGLFAFKELAVPAELHRRAFTGFCAKHFRKLSPLAEWLYANRPID